MSTLSHATGGLRALRILGLHAFLASGLIWGAAPQASAAADSYKLGELIVMFDSTAHATIDSILSASRANETVTGIAVFDSIGLVHQLQSIQASPQANISPIAKRLYTLLFPVGADIPSIAAAYTALPDVESAEPNYNLQATEDSTIGDDTVLMGPSNPDEADVSSDTSAFKAGELVVLFSEEHSDIIEATLSASQTEKRTIGVAAFDSIGAERQLQSILSDPQADVNAFARRMYILIFPTDADILQIAALYAELPYVVSAEPNFVFRAEQGDFDGDGRIDFSDFFLFVDVFGQSAHGERAVFDLVRDGMIDLSDFFFFVDLFVEHNRSGEGQ